MGKNTIKMTEERFIKDENVDKIPGTIKKLRDNWH